MPEHAEKSAAAGLDGIGQPAGGKDRGAQPSGESEQTENNRAGHTNGIRSDLADWAHPARRSTGKEHKQTARRAGTDSTRTPQADKAPVSPVPKGARHNRRERQRKRRGQPQKREARGNALP